MVEFGIIGIGLSHNQHMDTKTEQKNIFTNGTPSNAVRELKDGEKGVVISSREAQEYCEYKRQKKRAEISAAILRSEAVLSEKDDPKRVLEKAVRYRQAAVRVTPVTLAQSVGDFVAKSIKTDCVIGGTGETLSKVKAYEAKCALRLRADELTLVLAPSLLASCRYGAIRKELKKLRRVAKRAVAKAQLDMGYPQATMARVARICSEVGLDYVCVPYHEGCERLKLDLFGDCKLQVSEVQTLEQYKRLSYAGIGRIVTRNVQEIHADWMREVEEIVFPEKKLANASLPPPPKTAQNGDVYAKTTGNKPLNALIEVKAETKSPIPLPQQERAEALQASKASISPQTENSTGIVGKTEEKPPVLTVS